MWVPVLMTLIAKTEKEIKLALLYGKCGRTQSRTERQRCAVLPAKTYKIKTGVKGFS